MFASARTAATSPLASPSLKHVFAHTHSPLVGLGISMGGQGASGSAASSSIQTSFGSSSGQPVNVGRRPSLLRRQSSVNTNVTLTPPRTPRMQCAAKLPSVFIPSTPNPTGVHSPISEGYFSDDDLSSENTHREAGASGFQSMNMHTTDRRRFNATTNNSRSTLRSTLLNTYPDVERIGLGILGLTLGALNQSSIVRNVEPNDVYYSAPVADSSPETQRVPRSRMTSRPRLTKTMGFSAQVIGSPDTNDELDGYAADTETEDSFGHLSERRACRRSGLGINGLRSCTGRIPTPFYAPNGEVSWL